MERQSVLSNLAGIILSLSLIVNVFYARLAHQRLDNLIEVLQERLDQIELRLRYNKVEPRPWEPLIKPPAEKKEFENF
jgi:hypothetical protein